MLPMPVFPMAVPRYLLAHAQAWAWVGEEQAVDQPHLPHRSGHRHHPRRVAIAKLQREPSLLLQLLP
jgi:hypothetical protein